MKVPVLWVYAMLSGYWEYANGSMASVGLLYGLGLVGF